MNRRSLFKWLSGGLFATAPADWSAAKESDALDGRLPATMWLNRKMGRWYPCQMPDDPMAIQYVEVARSEGTIHFITPSKSGREAYEQTYRPAEA